MASKNFAVTWQLVCRSAVAFVAVTLLVLYGLSFYAFSVFGHWPAFGNPESWSMPLFADSERIFATVLSAVICAYVVSVLGVVIMPMHFLISSWKTGYRLFSIRALIAFIVFAIFLLDPGALVPWIVD